MKYGNLDKTLQRANQRQVQALRENVMDRMEWKPPDGFRRTLELSTGKAEVRVSCGIDTVDSKVYVKTDGNDLFGRLYRGPDGTGKPVTVKVQVRATTVRLKLSNGTIFKSRACCQDGDDFQLVEGVELAINRLVPQHDQYLRDLGSSHLAEVIAKDRKVLRSLIAITQKVENDRCAAEQKALRELFLAKKAAKAARRAAREAEIKVESISNAESTLRDAKIAAKTANN